MGPKVDWRGPARTPERRPIEGDSVRLEPLDPERHGRALYEASHGAGSDPHLWRYLFVGPFPDEAAFRAWLDGCARSEDPLFFAIVDRATGRPSGMASFMRITPGMGVIEIGNIWFAAAIQRTRQATEAIYLMARHAFEELGYRRFEWKCDALNARSRRAALRFGFTFEGIFRQHMVVKGRNRDTAWYAIVDGEWPAIKASFERWLAPENFDAEGRQRVPLAGLNRQGVAQG
ncbi:MAG TPA: GNAT family protein [Geminicoccaceae bacterium]|nr:GNAT family protein [Geminicoccaceae bacterium]